MFAILLICAYLNKRSHGLIDLQWREYVGKPGEARKALEETHSLIQTATKSLQEVYYGGTDTADTIRLCPTCNCMYSFMSWDGVTLCNNLREVFPHNPHHPAPTPNPFQWFWLTVNGYRMPPDDWPLNKPWTPETGWDRIDPVAAMSAEGRAYYETRENPLWEWLLQQEPARIGSLLAKVPEWYRVKSQRSS